VGLDRNIIIVKLDRCCQNRVTSPNRDFNLVKEKSPSMGSDLLVTYLRYKFAGLLSCVS